ncbi:preprotein translocase subunit SecA [Candidatus Termititenax persephonae]|uniref:Protein translocase subunit SecA n=1 Tax=Candidatus Termititenax persephonae TaxID=2218525 RepID=A0A388TGR5_9BACT|nr:preprotein translocase subunit SecA [Candidatus Termititenax persephonae]
MNLVAAIRGYFNAKKLSPYWEKVRAINALEPQISALSDAELRAKTEYFKQQLQSGHTLDDILPEAFAVVREAGQRVLNMRHFDVQLLGGMVLHEGRIAEMKTGEGKTLVATLPVYLNALLGQGVQVVTVNDYLAQRDAAWMGQLYTFLGLTVGVIVANLDFAARQAAYNADITYGTNNEFAFDYLRDNMATDQEQLVQRGKYYAIVDEVDSILIDEARTPLIISGQVEDSTDKYRRVLQAARLLQPGKYQTKEKAEEEKQPGGYQDFTLEEKSKHIALTEQGIQKAEKFLGIDSIFDIQEMDSAHMLIQCLKAVHLFKRDVDYIVKDDEVVIVDEFTGRLMTGRRYSDGLHQAIEAKENVRIQNESQTLASITFQNFFRMYQKLGGMTGTAKTEEMEFARIYNLAVLEIPTNQPVLRKDAADVIYKSKYEKYKAIVQDIKERHALGQPLLVGTISIEVSEHLSALLRKENIPHNVLNAKQHAREAEIIKNAGQRGAVTIATNMAGRGTDIVLGEGVTALGGLHVLGTERHESRRIDNQLRGRCGRQGDPGSSRFYISLEDDLMRIFGGQRISSMMERLGLPADTPIEHGIITSSIERAQKKVEQYHFSIRKQVLQYDDVVNRQRETIYALRHKLLMGKDVTEKIQEFLVKTNCLDKYKEKEAQIPPDILRNIERLVLLREIDRKWIDHLHNLDVLREGIGLRAYGQLDPLTEYKIEGFKLFQTMLGQIAEDTVETLLRVQVVHDLPPNIAENYHNMHYSGGELTLGLQSPMQGQARPPAKPEPRHAAEKIGRNDPCPCGSGKKYKNCHGAAR